MFRGKFTVSRGQQAVRIDDLIRRHRPGGADVLAAKRPATTPEATTTSMGAP